MTHPIVWTLLVHGDGDPTVTVHASSESLMPFLRTELEQLFDGEVLVGGVVYDSVQDLPELDDLLELAEHSWETGTTIQVERQELL